MAEDFVDPLPIHAAAAPAGIDLAKRFALGGLVISLPWAMAGIPGAP